MGCLLLRLQPSHTHCTEEVGGIKSIFRDTLATLSQLEAIGYSDFCFRTLTAQKKLAGYSQSSEITWTPSAN
jgi:hypothetical protein